MEIVNHKKF